MADIFHCVTGPDFGRANMRSKLRGNPLADEIRAKIAACKPQATSQRAITKGNTPPGKSLGNARG